MGQCKIKRLFAMKAAGEVHELEFIGQVLRNIELKRTGIIQMND
jgi:hypothetical protein